MDEMTLTLNSPLTEEQWDAIMDVDLENTPRIMFRTKHGQEVWYEKRKTGRWIPVSERLPENNRQVLVYAQSTHFVLAKYDEMRTADGCYKMMWVTFDAYSPLETIENVIAWMPLPEPYREEGGRR